MNKLTIIIILITLMSCATNGWERHMKSMGYSDADAKLIKPYHFKYGRMLASALAHSSSFVDKQDNARAKVFSVFCSCYKVIGNKCDDISSEELTDKKKLSWIKHHAAKNSLTAGSSILMGNVDDVDKDYCN